MQGEFPVFLEDKKIHNCLLPDGVCASPTYKNNCGKLVSCIEMEAARVAIKEKREASQSSFIKSFQRRSLTGHYTNQNDYQTPENLSADEEKSHYFNQNNYQFPDKLPTDGKIDIYTETCGILESCALKPIKHKSDLAKFGMRITVEVLGDGNCQFTALASEINRVKPDYVRTTQQELRSRSVQYIRDAVKQDAVMRVQDPNNVDIIEHWDNEDRELYKGRFDAYLWDLSHTRIFGSSITLKAISEVEKITIFVFVEGSSKPIVWKREWDVEKLGPGAWEDPVVYLYRSSSHYDVAGPPPENFDDFWNYFFPEEPLIHAGKVSLPPDERQKLKVRPALEPEMDKPNPVWGRKTYGTEIGRAKIAEKLRFRKASSNAAEAIRYHFRNEFQMKSINPK